LGYKNRREIGTKAEEQAAAYLKEQGYEILDRNYWCRFGEIDIIARNEEYLCFVEVKYRASSRYEAPEGVISAKKVHHICKASECYMQEKRIFPDTPVRYDVVLIVGEDISLIRDAFFYSTGKF